jgi:hypothetical protein
MKRVVIGATGVALALLSFRGLFVRWVADDFWTAAAVKTHGFGGAQVWWYRVWSGRFAYTFLATAIQMLTPRVAGALVTLVVITLLVVVARFTNLPLAFALVYATLLGTYDVPQSLLWQTGLLTYTLPLILPVIGAGFSEIGALAQIAAFAIWRKWWMLAASLAIFAVVAAAPGNAVRRSLYPSATHIVEHTLASTAMFFIDEIGGCGAALVLVFCAASRWPWKTEWKRWTAAAIAVALLAHAVTFATLSQPPPSRSLIVPHAFLVVAVAAIGATVRWRKWMDIILILACIGGPLVDACQIARSIPPARRFARAWDALDAQLRAAKGRDVVVVGVPGMVGTIVFITHDPRTLMNPAMAAYYGLHSIAAAPVSCSSRPEPLQNFPVNVSECPGGHDQHDIVRLRFAADAGGN